MNQYEIPHIKHWLDYLYYEVCKGEFDFYLQYSEKDGVMTKWKKYSEVCFDFENPKNKWFLSKVNQRQILPCEVVLDLESQEELQPALSKLRSFNLPYYVFSTGSRGFHIHIFFKRKLSSEEKHTIIKYFGADTMKAGDKCLIALEFTPHWKSGKIKELVSGECENAKLL